jgi:hypothetical protein
VKTSNLAKEKQKSEKENKDKEEKKGIEDEMRWRYN